MNDEEKDDLMKSIFDAIPSRLFVVDNEVKIQEYNAAAAELMMAERNTILKRRAGDILHCVHSTDVPEGCGAGPACTDCVIRNSVKEALKGNRVVRRRSRFDLLRDGNKIEIYGLVTASPFSFQQKTHALLAIEDISEIAEIYSLIHICCVCKKVRDDKESWIRVENYFKNSWDVDFSHGYCPDCLKNALDKLANDKVTKQITLANTVG